jgi:hypothetical protein
MADKNIKPNDAMMLVLTREYMGTLRGDPVEGFHPQKNRNGGARLPVGSEMKKFKVGGMAPCLRTPSVECRCVFQIIDYAGEHRAPVRIDSGVVWKGCSE